MRVTPVAAGSGTPGTSIGATQERTSPERIAAAKAVAMGESPMRLGPSDTPTDPQVARAQESMRRIKMRVNQTIPREIAPDEAQALLQTQAPEAPLSPEESTPSANPVASETVESEKPLSPQLAALARQRRALQVKERELAEREKALQSAPQQDSELSAKLKGQTLRVLQEQGLLTPEFYNELQEFLVSGANYDPEMQTLKDKLSQMEQKFEKSLEERDQLARTQALTEMSREATQIVATEGDAFKLVSATKSVPKAISLIERTFDQYGEILAVREALQLVEDQLREDYSPIADLLKPAPAAEQVQVAPQTRPIKTLTNRDTAQPSMDRRTRAILAAQNLLKR